MSYTLESPIDLTYEIEFNAIEYSVDELVLDSHVRIRVVFSGDKGHHQVKYAVIEGAAYDSWGSDDSVILKLLVANIVSLGKCDRELVIAFPLAGEAEEVEVSKEDEDVVDEEAVAVDVSGSAVDVSGSVVDVSGSAVDVSGSVVDVSGVPIE
tara:strand:+ start:579 stop:1037 length:459 start_codon:yes stop_codon:yes gene_type:complete